MVCVPHIEQGLRILCVMLKKKKSSTFLLTLQYVGTVGTVSKTGFISFSIVHLLVFSDALNCHKILKKTHFYFELSGCSFHLRQSVKNFAGNSLFLGKLQEVYADVEELKTAFKRAIQHSFD